MGIRLQRGRVFTDQDGREGQDQPSVIIVNETFAKTLWPDGRDPIRQRVRQGEKAPWLTVAGVVSDVKHYGLERGMRPGVYLPLPRVVLSTMSVAVKTAGDPAALIPPVRTIVRDLDPELPIYNAWTMNERMRLWEIGPSRTDCDARPRYSSRLESSGGASSSQLVSRHSGSRRRRETRELRRAEGNARSAGASCSRRGDISTPYSSSDLVMTEMQTSATGTARNRLITIWFERFMM